MHTTTSELVRATKTGHACMQLPSASEGMLTENPVWGFSDAVSPGCAESNSELCFNCRKGRNSWIVFLMTWMWTSSCPRFIMTSESWCSNKEGLPYHDLLNLLSRNRTSHLWNQCLWFLISDLISCKTPFSQWGTDFIVFFPEYLIYRNPVRCSKRTTTLALCFHCYFSITILGLFKIIVLCLSHNKARF